MHHKPALEVMAGAVPGVTPEVEVGLVAGLIVRVALRVYDQGPPPDFNWEEGDLWRTGGGARPQGMCREMPAGTSHFRCGDLARLARLPTEHPNLVGRIQCHSRSKGPAKACPQDLGLLLYP